MKNVLLLFMYLFVCFTLSIDIDMDPCSNAYNTNLNPNAPKNTNDKTIRDLVTAPSSIEMCKNLLGKQICCDSVGISYLEGKYFDFYEELDRRNFEVIFRFNEIMVDSLRNKLITIDLAKELNNVLKQANDQRDVIDSILKQIIGEEDEVPADVDQYDLKNIPLPKEYEEFRDSIEKYRGTFRDRFKQYREDIKNISNLSMFFNASFYSYNPSTDLQEFNLTQLENEYDLMQIRMRKLVSSTSECFSKLASYVLSIKCGTCDREFLNNILFEQEGVKLILEMNPSSCQELEQVCYPYIEILDELNQNIQIFILSEAAKDYQRNKNNNDQQVMSWAIDFMTNTQGTLGNILNGALFYDKPNQCKSNIECNYICSRLINSFGVDLNELFVNRLYVQVTQTSSGFRMNVSSLIQDLQEAMKDQFKDPPQSEEENEETNVDNPDDGSIPIDDPQNHIRILQESEVKININNDFNVFSISKAIGQEIQFDGTSGINVFNLSGQATQQDLQNYKTNWVIRDVKNPILMNEGCLMIFMLLGLTISL